MVRACVPGKGRGGAGIEGARPKLLDGRFLNGDVVLARALRLPATDAT